MIQKKTILFLLLLLCLGVLLSATGTKEVSSEEPVTLTWHLIGGEPNDFDVVMTEVNKYLLEKLNIQLDATVHGWGDFDQKTQVMIAADEPYDLVFTASWANNYFINAQRGAFLEVEDLLQEHGKDILSQIPEAYWDAIRVDGNLYGILLYQIYADNSGIAIQKEFADKYDFNPDTIKTFADLEGFYKTIKANETDIWPTGTGRTGDGWHHGDKAGNIGPDIVPSFEMVMSNFFPLMVRPEDPNLEILKYYETPEWKRAMWRFKNIIDNGWLRPDFQAVAMEPDFGTGKYAVMYWGNAKPGSEDEALRRYGMPCYIVRLAKPKITTAGVSATMTAIGRNSRHPEKAMQLINLIYADKYLYNLLAFGIEGIHYSKLGDGRIELNSDIGYGLQAWALGNQFNAYPTAGQSVDVWEETKMLNQNAVVSPLLGFPFDSDPVKTEIAQVGAIWKEYFDTHPFADDPDALLNDAAKKMEAGGIQKIADEMRKQIDAWRAAK